MKLCDYTEKKQLQLITGGYLFPEGSHITFLAEMVYRDHRLPPSPFNTERIRPGKRFLPTTLTIHHRKNTEGRNPIC